MLLTEWNWDDAKAVWQEEAREEGREEGREESIKNLLEFGMTTEQIAQALKLPFETVEQYRQRYIPPYKG
jgi:predicted transposase/invertase (TIGR01784 family)